MWCVTAPSAGHLTLLFIYLFFTSNIPPWKFSPLTWDQFPQASVRKSPSQQLTSDQLSSARLGSARLWRFPLCIFTTGNVAELNTSELCCCCFYLFLSTCNQQFEGRTQEKGGNIYFLLDSSGGWTGFPLVRACCCVYRALSWDLQPHEGLFTLIIWMSWFRFFNLTLLLLSLGWLTLYLFYFFVRALLPVQ